VSDENVKQLAEAFRFGQAVIRALPIDEEAERMVSEMMRRASKGYVGRKLKPKGQP
jgi:hypothetical protein